MNKFVVFAAVSAFGLVTAAYAQNNAGHMGGQQMPCSMSSGDCQRGMGQMGGQMGGMGMMRGAQSPQASYSTVGKVVSITPAKAEAKASLTVAHAAVKALQWPAMSMTFALDSPDMLNDLHKGDAVAIEFVKRDSDWVITHLEKSGS